MTMPGDSGGFSGEGIGASVLRPGDGQGFRIGQMRLTVKEAGERTGGQLVILEIDVPAGASSPPPTFIAVAERAGTYSRESWTCWQATSEVATVRAVS